jgi:glycerol-3-phosphate acyltransferase PlsY
MQVFDVILVAAALIAGFALGGIPFGIIVPRLIGGPDPRTLGSGRTGGANVSRAVGYRWALVSGLLDVAKGSVSVLLIIVLGGGVVPQVLAALAAIVGHSRSPYIGFRGGRGVAPATGGALIIAPVILFIIFPVFALTILITRISSGEARLVLDPCLTAGSSAHRPARVRAAPTAFALFRPASTFRERSRDGLLCGLQTRPFTLRPYLAKPDG